MLTVGVEEEFLLLREDGSAAPVAAEVVRSAEAEAGTGTGEIAGTGAGIGPEYMAYQVETRSRVCTTLAELRADLHRLRLLASRGAERAGARLVAVGGLPFRTGAVHAVTSDPRYLMLARRYPTATFAGAACACQVHVGVADRDLAVEVLARLRPWLPALLALSANSPIVGGQDSGWASTRYCSLLLWPTFRPPGIWTGAEQYDATVTGLIEGGAAMDHASVYLLARLSARYPTIEVRVADALLSAEDTVLLAALVRALVTTLVEDALAGHELPSISPARVSAGLLTAAHFGLSARHALRHNRALAAAELLPLLLTKVAPALESTGDLGEVFDGLDRLHRTGTGAERQRALWVRSADPRAFVAGLAGATVPVPSPG